MTTTHPILPRSEWIDARRRLLLREKEFTRLRDELNAARQALPWEAVEREYRFDGPRGAESLADLFDGRSQLIVYHFMFAPEAAAGCPHCSFWADSFDGGTIHLYQRDVTFVVVSRAPYARLADYQRRMGWRFKWVSSGESSFNYDYQASFHSADRSARQALYNFEPQDPGGPDREGVSVFSRSPDGKLWHTYSTYARGIDLLNPTYNWLDLVPKGRDEGDRGQSWVRRHDEY
jgi:predicted dithiol-disulfide oxidoreductase (DUF899 family)